MQTGGVDGHETGGGLDACREGLVNAVTSDGVPPAEERTHTCHKTVVLQNGFFSIGRAYVGGVLTWLRGWFGVGYHYKKWRRE